MDSRGVRERAHGPEGIVSTARVLDNLKLNEDTHVLVLASDIAQTSVPGQFVNLKTSHLLRRPIGIMSSDRENNRIEIGVKIVGEGTLELCSLARGDEVSIVGPLGQGFSFTDKDRIITVGGGTGIFPLLSVLEAASERHIPTTAIAGFRSVSQATLVSRLHKVANVAIMASDTGGLDFVGSAAAALENLLAELSRSGALLMSRVTKICQNYDIRCEVSLEARMACGVGICVGCAVPVIDTETGDMVYKRCCYDGPVFAAEDVAWTELAAVE